MALTREDVADLREGDVVELQFEGGATVRGPLVAEYDGLEIKNVGWPVRRENGSPQSNPTVTGIAVVDRAPRPFYTNHPRLRPVAGDVLSAPGEPQRIARPVSPDGDLVFWAWSPRNSQFLYATESIVTRNGQPTLLVDGKTGSVVLPAGAHISLGDNLIKDVR